MRLERELGVSSPLAQVLVRRGLNDSAAAHAFLAADEAHPPEACAGIDDAVATVLAHLEAGSLITVHGDYDADGVCSTAVLVRCLRELGAQVDWHLPSRSEDGYGLSVATVQRLAARGTRLLLTADCAITAVEEVAAARAAGLEVVVTDHHAPRADGALPAAPIVHPRLGGYPCPDLCATGVAYKLAQALLAAAGCDPSGADEDLDVVALATVADCVPLQGENRRLVREGLEALALTRRPGLRALMRVAQLDPGRVDAHAVAFRLAPRINAAGRLYRADAGLELLLTPDDARATEIAQELDAANTERRHTETRILFAAEAQVAAAGPQPAYVLAGDDWHPGVIGIVASRLVERHHRPVVMVALAGHEGTGSGRSIPGFDLLAGLDACAAHLLRHGGHRAAAGCTVARAQVDDLREAFVAHAAATLAPEDLVPRERVDAIVSGGELGAPLAEELGRLAPFGIGNPAVSLLVPAAALTDARPMGEGKHLRFTVESGGVRARAVAFGVGSLPAVADGPLDATFSLELNEYKGAVEPRLVLRGLRTPVPEPIETVGEPQAFLAGALAELAQPLEAVAGEGAPAGADMSAGGRRTVVDRRDLGVAGTVAAVVASGAPVLCVCADVARRRAGLEGRLGGFALCSYTGLERDPSLAARHPHVVALDPGWGPHHAALLEAGEPGQTLHLAWGEPEVAFSERILESEYALRPTLASVYRALRAGAGTEEALRGDGPRARSATLAGRALRVLHELGLVELEGDGSARLTPAQQRTDLERSPAFIVYAERLRTGRRWLERAGAIAA